MHKGDCEEKIYDVSLVILFLYKTLTSKKTL